jgi:hypothetical protein
LAIGNDDPVSRVVGLSTNVGSIDWAAIGGRFSGRLVPIPGATSSLVYGDAMPSFEAAVMTRLSPTSDLHRPGGTARSGVDQVRHDELDLRETFANYGAPAYILDEAGHLHTSAITNGENVAMFLHAYGLPSEHPDIPRLLASGSEHYAEWEERAAAIVRAANPRALVTVVDAHT